VDLVPVLSQLVLRARCRHCGSRFSWRYLAVEVVCGALYSAAFLLVARHRDGDALLLARLLVTAPCLVAVIVVDFETYTIPDSFIVVLAGSGLAYDVGCILMGRPALPPIVVGGGAGLHIPQSIVGGMIGFGGLWLVSRGFGAIVGEESMGFGDVKLLGAAGTLFGAGWLLLAFFLLAAGLGAAAGIGLVVYRRIRGTGGSEHRVARTRLPFGPFLALSAGVALAFPKEMVAALGAVYGVSV
jgi:leader peptidase (prepilin peptidase)/N-methyltransferase